MEVCEKEKTFLLIYLLLLPLDYQTSNAPVSSAGIFKALSMWKVIAKWTLYRRFFITQSAYVTQNKLSHFSALHIRDKRRCRSFCVSETGAWGTLHCLPEEVQFVGEGLAYSS